MPRYIKEATGAAAPVVGSEESQIVGKGTGLYDAPGVWSPIYVCEGWDTPFEGPLEFCFNPSEYDELKVVLRGYNEYTSTCYDTGLIAFPLNNQIEAGLSSASYCICNTFRSIKYCCGSGCAYATFNTPLIGPLFSCFANPGYTEICMYKGTYGRVCNGNMIPSVRPLFEINHIHCNSYFEKYYYHIDANRCLCNIYWPSQPGDYTGDVNAFTKINLCMCNCNCFFPGTECCNSILSNINDAFIGFYGKKRYTTYPSDRDI